MRHFKWIAPVITLFVLAYWYGTEQNTEEQGVLTDSVSAPAKTEQAGSFVSADQLVEPVSTTHVPETPLPMSLRGTDVEGGFRVDEDGNLIIDLGVKRYFDYFLATVGEETIAEITARLRHGIDAQLDDPAKSQALQLLESYLSYKVALYDLEQSDELSQQYTTINPLDINQNQLPSLVARMEAIHSARRAHFDDEVVEAFFGGEEMFDRYTLAKLKIMNETALSHEEREAQLRELDESLPSQVRERREEVTQYQRYQATEARLKEQSASPAEIHQLRAEEFGEDAAMRLAELDRKRIQWDQRLQVYRQEKAQFDQAGLSQQDLTSELKALRTRHFSEQETRRVIALDQIHEN